MNFKHSLSVMCLVMMASLCCGYIGDRQFSLQDITPRVYCGRNLARVLAFLCYGEPLNEKRSEGTMHNAVLAPFYKLQEKQNWPWMPHHIARSVNMQRSKRHIVAECCEKPCDISELLSYC